MSKYPATMDVTRGFWNFSICHSNTINTRNSQTFSIESYSNTIWKELAGKAKLSMSVYLTKHGCVKHEHCLYLSL